MQADVDRCLDVLISQQPPVQPADALAALRNQRAALSVTYLEAALSSGFAEAADFHQPLARLYLSQISDPSTAPAEATAATDKLLELLRTSPNVDAAALQAALPEGPRVRRMSAALHEVMGEWDAAMRVLVDEVGDYEEAEAFTDRLYARMVRP